MGRWFRTPKTHNEMVANCRDEEFVRGKRKVRSLVSAWDDIHRHRERGWKWQKKCKCQFGGSRERIEYDDSYLDPVLETYKLYGE